MSPALPSPPRVQVLGADPLARGGLLALLQAADLPTGDVAPDVVLWDLGPGTGPWQEALRLSADRPLLALVRDEEAARHALSRGASGVLLRSVEPARLVAAVFALAADLVVLDDLLAVGLLPETAEGRPGDTARLSPREAEVLALLADGLTNAAIGEALEVSTHTARFHVRAVLAKLEARNRAGAVARALKLGLLRS